MNKQFFNNEAFHTICKDAKPASSFFVSLYEKVPFYGGAEEGGWWGEDIDLMSYQEFVTEAQAIAAKEQIEALVLEMNAKARSEYGAHCERQNDWLEANGMDSESLLEVNGEESYFVTFETEAGSHESRGDRRWE